MEFNKEAALHLWNRIYKNKTKVHDFAGRTIVKEEYNNSNSKYGWNLDYIVPVPEGGINFYENLICCHLLTIAERKGKYPYFVANNVKFGVLKVDNIYEIRPIYTTGKQNNNMINKYVNKPKHINQNKSDFMDSDTGISYFKKLKGIQNKKRFVGSIFIQLSCLRNTAVVDFIEKIFEGYSFSYTIEHNIDFDQTRITVQNFDLPLIKDTNKMLDKCILLNTYLGHYFREMNYLNNYDIYFRLDCYDSRKEMYEKSKNISFNDVSVAYTIDSDGLLNNTIYINKLVWENSEAKDDINFDEDCKWVEYDYSYENLADNLDDEVNKKLDF